VARQQLAAPAAQTAPEPQGRRAARDEQQTAPPHERDAEDAVRAGGEELQ
jgi:hypothetical protein